MGHTVSFLLFMIYLLYLIAQPPPDNYRSQCASIILKIPCDHEQFLTATLTCHLPFASSTLHLPEQGPSSPSPGLRGQDVSPWSHMALADTHVVLNG